MPYIDQFPTDPVFQYIGKTDGAQEGGSEQIYMPRLGGSWRSSVKVGTLDPTQANVPSLSAGPAGKNLYGRAFDDAARGLVCYQGGHTIARLGDVPSSVAAQRIFFNFSYLAMSEKFPSYIITNSSVTTIVQGTTINNLQVNGGNPLPAGTTVLWTAPLGTFSNATGVTTNYTAPASVAANTQIIITATISDGCRSSFDSWGVTLTPGARSPIAMDDAGSMLTTCAISGTPFTLNALANDSDPDGDLNTYITLTGVDSGGTWVNNGLGSVTFTPRANFTGTAAKTYQVCDNTAGTPLCATATIRITVGSIDVHGCGDSFVWGISASGNADAVFGTPVGVTGAALATGVPEGVDNTTAADMGTTIGNNFILHIPATLNGPNRDTVWISWVAKTSGGAGATMTVEQSTNGTTFTNPRVVNTTVTTIATPAYTGYAITATGINYIKFSLPTTPDRAPLIDGIDYEIYSCIPKTPVLQPDSYIVLEDSAKRMGVLTNDRDPLDPAGVGGTLKIKSVTQPANGRVSINTDNTLTYRPSTDFRSTNSFTYTAVNGEGYSATATVNITIQTDGCSPGQYKTFSGTPVEITLGAILATKAVQIREDGANATTNFSGSNVIEIGKKIGRRRRGLFYFPNITTAGLGIPTDAIITSATFSIYRATGDNVVKKYGVYTLGQDFTENQTTWNIAQTAINWTTTTGGGVYSGPVSSINIGATNGYKDFDVTAAVASFIAGTATNNGFIVKQLVDSSAGGTADRLHTFSDQTVAAQQPKLVIKYVVPDVCATIPNRSPLSLPDTVITTAGAANTVTFAPMANDREVDSTQTISLLSILTQPAAGGGTAALSGNNIIYTPGTTASSSTAPFTFTYRIQDNGSPVKYDTATVYCLVNVALPSVNRDSATVNANSNVVIAVSANDSIPGSTLTIPTITLQPTNGTAVVGGSGPNSYTITYTPTTGFSGLDTLIYSRANTSVTGCNTTPASDTALVVIRVTNQKPDAVDDNKTTWACNTTVFNVLSNDTDPEGGALTVEIVTQPNPLHASVSVNLDNTIKFVPVSGYFSVTPVPFTYRVADNGNPVKYDTATVSVTINQNSSNVAPTANADVETTTMNNAVFIEILSNDSDANGDAFTPNLTGPGLTLPTKGTITLTPNGLLRYMPNLNVSGVDEFQYRICDVHEAQPPGCPVVSSLCSIATVTVTIIAPDINQPLSLTGTIWDDADSSAAGTFTNIRTNSEGGAAGTGLYVYLIDNLGKVLDFSTVNEDGTYSLGSVPQNTSGLTLRVSSTVAFFGDNAPATVLPTGYVATSPPTRPSFGSTAISITGIDFGIEQKPSGAIYTAASQTNPGGTNAVVVPSAAFTGTDPEDGTYTVGLSGRQVRLSPATIGTLYYNGVAVNSATVITSFNPALVTLDPIDGTIAASFDYEVYDNAGVPSVAKAITLPFTVISLRLKVLLQGSTLGNGTGFESIMRDNLRNSPFTSLRYIPNADPYTNNADYTSKYTAKGDGLQANLQTIIDPTIMFASNGTSSAVDWVFIELRDKNNPATVLATRSAIVQRDGTAVDIDGSTCIKFPTLVLDNYYVAIRHRNHLGVMSAATIPATSFDCSSIVDFTTMTSGQLYNKAGYDGYEMATLSDGKRALWACDADGSRKIKYTAPQDDLSRIFNEVLGIAGNTTFSTNYNFGFGYWSGDVNMDSNVKYTAPQDDPSFVFNAILNYQLNVSFVTNYNFFIEQLP